MVEIAGFVVFDGAFDACGVLQLWELRGVRFDSIAQIRRSAVVADEDTISVYRVIENAGGLHRIHDHCHILITSGDEYVDVRNIVANQVPLLSKLRFDGQDSEDVRDGVGH
jgi:hypothetical protein